MKPRCGLCAACRLVEDTKGLLMPRPYGPRAEHANQSTVDCWNTVLADNPCAQWAPNIPDLPTGAVIVLARVRDRKAETIFWGSSPMDDSGRQLMHDECYRAYALPDTPDVLTVAKRKIVEDLSNA